MLKVPFIVLSYGDFVKTKKLFSYEKGGIHTLPVFIDPVLAHTFAERMSNLLSQDNNETILRTQICSSKKYAMDMLTTICSVCPDLYQLVIDPSPPNPIASEVKLIDDIVQIDDAIDFLVGSAVGKSEQNGSYESEHS